MPPKKKPTIHLSSKAEMARFAAAIAKDLSQKRGPVVIGLVGDLGAGKTAFTQAFLKYFGVKERVTSPTFILMRKHELRIKNYDKTYHFDLYRIESAKELLALGFKKIVSNPGHIVLVEWADKFKKVMPQNTTWIEIEHGAKKTERRITVRK